MVSKGWKGEVRWKGWTERVGRERKEGKGKNRRFGRERNAWKGWKGKE